MDPVTASWTLSIRAPLADVWRQISDTDAFNRAAGLGYQFEEKVGEDGRVKRTGTVKRFGMTVIWDELPFVIEAPRRWINTRIYRSGPLERSVVSAELDAQGEETRWCSAWSCFPGTGCPSPS